MPFIGSRPILTRWTRRRPSRRQSPSSRRGSRNPRDNAVVESVERVVVGEEPGLVLLWSQTTYDQGLRRFGFMTTGRKLLERYGGDRFDTAIADLRLLVIEPHGTSADHHTRTWFRDV